MQKFFSLFIALGFCTIAMAQKSTDNFSGKWKTSEGVIIEITKSNASFIGKPIGKDILILKDLTFTNGKWIGILNNPKNNTTVNCEANLESNKIKFIAKKGMIKKEVFWTKEN
jgi:uncharacterized protein (DUF2147 family)